MSLFDFDIALGENAEDAVELTAEQTAFLENAAIASGLTDVDEAMLDDASLNEASMPARSIIRLSKQDRLKGLTMTSALTIAQQKRDPMFIRFAKLSKKRFALKQAILRKYQSQANVTARTILRNVGKRTMTDIGKPAKNTV